MLIESDKIVIPNETYEPGRNYQISNVIEHKYAFGVGGWMAEHHYDEIENNYNGSWDDYFESHLDEFWTLLKERVLKYFDKKFLGWYSIDGQVYNILVPIELWEIDYHFSNHCNINYSSDIPVRIIIHFESVEDFDYDSDLEYE